MSTIGVEGGIAVRLRSAAGRVVGVTIDNARPRQPGRMFVGRPVAEVPAMLPLLFSLCGNAQAIAALRAIEDAAGIVAPPPHQVARRLLLAAETVLEHGQGILRDWPELLAEPADLAAVRSLRAALVPLRGLLYPGKAWAQPGGGALSPDVAAIRHALAQAREVLEQRLFAGPAAEPLADRAAFAAWGRGAATPAARLIGRLSAELADWGANDVPLLPPLAAEALAARLADDTTDTFAAWPDWAGTARLAHPLSRRSRQPLVAAIVADCGNGALALAAARLADLQLALDEADRSALELQPHPGGDHILRPDGCGLGMAEAARGLLVHRIAMTDGRVGRYQLLAPTEWNFHPDGALARGLLHAEDGADLTWRARLLAALIDPCVAVSVSVDPA